MDVDPGERAEKGGPQNAMVSVSGLEGRRRCRYCLQEYQVPCPKPVALQERHGIDETGKGRQTGHNLCICPLAVGGNMGSRGGMEVHTIKAGDGECQHELQES